MHVPRWLLNQWNEIKGNAKWSLFVLIFQTSYAAAVASIDGLAGWKQAALWLIFIFMVSWALVASAHRGRGSIQSEPSAEPPGATPPATEIPPPDPTADAPQLLIRYVSQDLGSVTFINDGPGSMVSPQLGPLEWKERRSIEIIGDPGTLSAGQQSEHRMSFETSPDYIGELWHFLRNSTPHDGITTVTATYQDARGRRFAREFTLTTNIDGTITWQPGAVRLVS
jgi:hypothetical protein